MTKTTCSVPECVRVTVAKGLCHPHYKRLKRNGSLGTDPIRIPDSNARFWSYVDKTGDCWVWRKSLNGHGYGQMWWQGTVVQAHQIAYTLTHGPVPDGLELDHLCRNRACCNPAHLEAVTHAENMRRALPYR